MFDFLTRPYRNLKCQHGYHNGPIVKQGYPLPIAKNNKPAVPLNDIYWIRRCSNCGEVFSNSDDLVQKKNVPYLI